MELEQVNMDSDSPQRRNIPPGQPAPGEDVVMIMLQIILCFLILFLQSVALRLKQTVVPRLKQSQAETDCRPIWIITYGL